ncbi:hypothetical protein ABFV74_06095 [Pseudoalteromonas distincta]|uniref:hypothetical protein n=1 Tax=Pseudoalteromonas distincta TaxID=77608 RepID=UPI0032188B32
MIAVDFIISVFTATFVSLPPEPHAVNNSNDNVIDIVVIYFRDIVNPFSYQL